MERFVKVHTTRNKDKRGPEDEEEKKETDDINNYDTNKIS
jgi:hypothetical protein